jgi:hypothetical protein
MVGKTPLPQTHVRLFDDRVGKRECHERRRGSFSQSQGPSVTEKQRTPSESEWLIIEDVDVAYEDWGGESEIIVEAEP